MTTDITELAQSLKAAAEKATPGEWVLQLCDEVYATDDGVNYEQVAIATLDARDADYIALANPANILALVEALENAQTERDEFRKRLKLERSILEDADRRIAELESRTVKLPEAFYPDGDIDCPLVMEKADVIKAMTAKGIKWEAE